MYEQPLTSESQRRAVAEIENMVKEYREAEQKHVGYSTLARFRSAEGAGVPGAAGHGRTSGRPKSRAFVEFLFAQFPEKESAVVTPQEAGSRIIIP